MIRKAKEKDIKECVTIEYEAFGENKNIIEHDLTKQIKDGDYIFFVAEIKGKIAGFATAKKHAWNRSVYVERLYIRKKERGKGCGSKLLTRIITVMKNMKMRKVFVDAGAKNKGVIRFYLKNGFVKAGHIKDFYDDPNDKNGIVFSYDL
jgi:ribosomal protein S18 acetylase RimI-like enzyme